MDLFARTVVISLEEAMRAFTSHSLRSAVATSVALAEVVEVDFLRHGGWKLRQAMLAYSAGGLGCPRLLSKWLSFIILFCLVRACLPEL